METEFGELWPAVNIGQVYLTPARLEAAGLVRSTEVNQDSRPAKRMFELMPAGHEELRRWVDDVVPAARLRDRFFVKPRAGRSAPVGRPISLPLAGGPAGGEG